MSNATHLSGAQAWLNFRRITCATNWSYRNLILLGDAAHTAHFSIGSGTKLALEDAIKLAEVLNRPGLARDAALAEYQAERNLEVLKLQNSARNSTEWFETLDRYLHFEPIQFAYSLLTRSQRVSHENLRLRDRAWLEGVERWFQSKALGARRQRARAADVRAVPPARARAGEPRRRLADGDVFGRGGHAGRLPPRPLRRARPGRRGPRLYRDDLCLARRAGSRRAARASTRRSMSRHGGGSSISSTPTARAKFCLQLGHSGPKGSTKVGWEGYDVPLESGNWPVMAASDVAWSPPTRSRAR